jgi:hypothetical protein
MHEAMTLRRLSVLLLCALLTVLAVGCGGGGGGGTAIPENLTVERLTQSAAASANARTGRFEFDMEMTIPGADEPFSFTGAGTFDADAKRAALSIDMSSFAKMLGQAFGGFGGLGGGSVDFGDADAWKIEAVQDGLVLYMRFPLIAEKLPDGKSWVRIDAGEVAKAQGFDLDQLKQFTENDPRKTLDYLRAVAGNIVPVGADEVRGEATTHYKATIDLLKYKSLVPASQRAKLGSTFDQAVQQMGLRYVPTDLWVDGDGLVRKMTITLSMTDPASSQSVEMAMSFEMFDYGRPVDIELPSPGEVAEVSSLDALG